MADTGRRLACLALALASLLLLRLAWHAGTDGFLSDDAVYLMMADFFSPYRDEASGHLGFLLSESLFPPLYPLLLGLVGAGSETSLAAHLLTAGSLVGALCVFAIWVRRETGSLALGCLLATACAMLPFSLVHVTEIWSEPLYLLLVCTFFWLVSRRTENPNASALPAALAVGLALLTRSAGIALLPALAMHLLRAGTRASLVGAAIALALPLTWAAVKRLLYPGEGYLGLLGDSLAATGAWAYLTAVLPARLGELWQAWNGILTGQASPSVPLQAACALILILALLGLTRRLARPTRPDALFVLTHAALLLLWSAPGHYARLLYPIVPLLLFYAVQAASGLTSRARETAWTRLGRALPFLALVAGLLPGSAAIVHRHFTAPSTLADGNYAHTRYWLTREDGASAAYDIERRAELVHFLRNLERHVPAGACVHSTHVPLVMLHSRRVSILYPQHGRSGFTPRCDYFLLMNFGSLDFAPLAPMESVVGLGAHVVDSVSDSRGILVGVLLAAPAPAAPGSHPADR